MKFFFNIVYIGGVSIRKGIHYLIDAFNKLKYSNKKLHLIGDHINNDKEFFSDNNCSWVPYKVLH